MDHNEVKAKLRTAGEAYRRYRIAADTEQSYYAQVTGSAIRYDRFGGGMRNSAEAKLIRLCGYSEKREAAQRKWIQAREQVTDMIAHLNSEKHSCVLIYRYINNYRFEEIAEVMGCSVNNIFKLHREALDILSEVQYE